MLDVSMNAVIPEAIPCRNRALKSTVVEPAPPYDRVPPLNVTVPDAAPKPCAPELPRVKVPAVRRMLPVKEALEFEKVKLEPSPFCSKVPDPAKAPEYVLLNVLLNCKKAPVPIVTVPPVSAKEPEAVPTPT